MNIRPANPWPAAFTRRGRPGGAKSIHQIQVHATRGPTTMEKQVAATENWFAQQPDRGGWGSSADFVVGPDYRNAGKIVIVQFGDWIRTFSAWSAGYGSLGATYEYGAAEVGVAIEVAQPDNNTPFTEETIDAVAALCDWINDELEAAGGERVPAVHIPTWDQRRSKPIPRGYIGHDELENGRKLGKTDPGRLWDWQGFLDRLSVPVEKKPPPLDSWRLVMAAVDRRLTTVPVRYRGDTAVYELYVRSK